MSFMAKLQFGSDNAEFKDLRSSMISLFTALYMDFDAELWFAGDYSRLIFMVSYVVLVGAPISCINTLCRRLVCYRCGTKIGGMLIMIPVPAAAQHTVMSWPRALQCHDHGTSCVLDGPWPRWWSASFYLTSFWRL